MSAASRPGERGAALLVVMVAVTVLTVLAVDLAYETRVSLRIAANARDELQATYLAKSGVALSRLVLSMQADVDAAIPTLPAAISGGASLPHPQIWRLVPVDSSLAANLFGGGLGAPAAAAPEGSMGAGPSSGGFDALVDDEGRKVNMQFEGLGTGLLGPQVQAVYQLICEPRWDPLFDREDENGTRVSRQDLLVYLHDWVDSDEQSSALAAAFPATCVMVTPQNPFEVGFQDENYAYDRGEDRYRAKNARMDSLGELSLVAGISDAFLAAFGDAITVYLPRDEKRNLNETDPDRLVDLAKIVADPPNQPALYDAKFKETLAKLVHEKTLGGILVLSPWDFGQLVGIAGVNVATNRLTKGSPQNPFTDTSSTFRVVAKGRAGDVQKTIDAVVRLDKQAPGKIVTVPGRLVHWREE